MSLEHNCKFYSNENYHYFAIGRMLLAYVLHVLANLCND